MAKRKTTTIYVPADRVAFVQRLNALPDEEWSKVAKLAESVKAEIERAQRDRQRMEKVLEALADHPEKLEAWLDEGERRVALLASDRIRKQISKRKAVRS